MLYRCILDWEDIKKGDIVLVYISAKVHIIGNKELYKTDEFILAVHFELVDDES